MIEILNGWFAYILTNNSAATFIFIGVLLSVAGLLIRLQFKKDQFDLRAIISTYKEGHYVPTTDKTLLVGCWIVSTYLTIEHYTETALTAYLGFWVLNGGVAAWSKVSRGKQAAQPEKPKEKDDA